jgi:hypothetical protein
MVSRHRRIALGAIVLVLASSVPTVATAQTTTPTTPTPTTTAPAPATTRKATPTTVRRTTTVKRTTTAKSTATTEAPTTTAAPTTVATTVASTISPTTIALVTTPSVAAVRVNDTSSTRTVNGVIVGLLVLAGLVALLTFWFYKRTAPLPASLEVLEFMGRRSWRKAPAEARAAQLAALRAQIGEVPPENIVNIHPVPIERPPWRPTETPDDSVADALVALVPPPPPPPAADGVAVADGVANEEPATDPAPPLGPPSPAPAAPSEPGDRPADTLDPHG